MPCQRWSTCGITGIAVMLALTSTPRRTAAVSIMTRHSGLAHALADWAVREHDGVPAKAKTLNVTAVLAISGKCTTPDDRDHKPSG